MTFYFFSVLLKKNITSIILIKYRLNVSIINLFFRITKTTSDQMPHNFGGVI